MKKYTKSLIVVGMVWASFTLACLVLPNKESSESERRKLAQFPVLSLNTIQNGTFMTKFESYSLDQFPLRDTFRKLKAGTSRYLFWQKDNNGYYMVNDYVAKLDFPLKENSVSHALTKIQYIYDSYLDSEKQNIFVSVVPDKGYFLAEDNGYPAMDYEKLFAQVKEGTPYAKYIDITGQLTIDSYYKTDTHWRQENIENVAETLKMGMGAVNSENSKNEYQVMDATNSFYGVYAGQSGYSVKPEKLHYLTNEILESCVVTYLEDTKNQKIYNLSKVNGKDPYDIFLSGATPLVTIENPNVATDKELIVFRDSFGSSLVPLLAAEYSKITLVDIRYLKSSLVGEYVTFFDQDVLFLYSSLLLNDSYSMG